MTKDELRRSNLKKRYRALKKENERLSKIIENQGARIDELVEDKGRIANALKEVVNEVRRNPKRISKSR